MVPSWIAEHESDKRALEKAGLDSIISTLVKVHVNRTLKSAGLLGVVDESQIEYRESSKDMWKDEFIFFTSSNITDLFIDISKMDMRIHTKAHLLYASSSSAPNSLAFLLHHACSD
jgi:hypothetical protein